MGVAALLRPWDLFRIVFKWASTAKPSLLLLLRCAVFTRPQAQLLNDIYSLSHFNLPGRKIPESEYTTLPSGLKIYDVTVGTGRQAVKGCRVVVHYTCKWKGITFQTSRQGAGVTGGVPIGWNLGTPRGTNGAVLPGLDQGVEGMRVGGQRRLIVPPALGYGSKGVQEIPPGATLDFEVELLSIKSTP